MTKKRFTIKQQDDYFGVVDNNTDDKTCVVNGIRTEIEAEWLCDSMNKLNDENEQLKQQNRELQGELQDKELGLNLWNAENTILEEDKKQLQKENKELKQENEYFKELLDEYEIETNEFDKFMNNREHTRLSINLETNELQRHIYATGNWFGDFDRVLVKQWLDEETYHRFINRVIEVYNTEFKRSPKK